MKKFPLKYLLKNLKESKNCIETTTNTVLGGGAL